MSNINPNPRFEPAVGCTFAALPIWPYPHVTMAVIVGRERAEVKRAALREYRKRRRA